MAKGKSKEVYRFSAGTRFVHWAHAVAFFLLLFTGLGVLLVSFQPVMTMIGGIYTARVLHRIMAIVLIAAMVIGLAQKPFRAWIGSCLSFGKKDFAHAKNFPVEFFGGHKPFPPQGKFNGGEKLNSLLQIVAIPCIAISGLIIWFPASFPIGLVQWAYPIHAGFALLSSAVILCHLYLSLLHPDSNQALKGMFNGYVPAKFAYEHYEEWYNDIKAEQKLDDFPK